MHNVELEWISIVAEALNQPQTYNERKRLVKIMCEAMPRIILLLDEITHSNYENEHTHKIEKLYQFLADLEKNSAK